ncbi:MAG: hypothetical protein M1546_18945 [Chloroflexi bacterium]|nr:hypothetical protein [Chloroflexota bacterium]
MRQFLVLLTAGIVLLALTACGDLVQIEQTKADAAKIDAQALAVNAEAQRLQAETAASTTRALIAAQDARIADYQLILVLAFVLAAGSMGLSLAMALILRSAAKPQIVYQVVPPVPLAQIGTPDTWPEQRARQRALVRANQEVRQ